MQIGPALRKISCLVALVGASIAGASPWSLLHAATVGQVAPVSGNLVQAEIRAAIAAQQPSYTLPNATILLDKPLVIDPGTWNFTLVGQANTKLTRNVPASFPLLIVGRDDLSAFTNSALTGYPRFNVAPAAEGATSLTAVGTAPPPGWYVIVGEHATNDVVRTGTGVAYNFKRELIQITGTSGNQLTLAHPLGRAFETPALFQVAPQGSKGALVNNVRLLSFWVDGRLGDRSFGGGDRLAVNKNNRVQKAVVVGTANNVTLENVSVSGFNNSGVGVLLSRNVFLQNCNIWDGNVRTLGYGVEVAGSRFVAVQNSSFADVRWGVVFTAGSMDGYVGFSSIPPGRGGFDAGHGGDERRITYQSCVADAWTIGNPAFLRGAADVQLLNCTARNEINIYGNTRDILIQGRHPSQSLTTQRVNLFSEQVANAIPSGVTFPISVTIRQAVLAPSLFTGRAVVMQSLSNVPPRLGSLTLQNSLITNASPGPVLFFNQANGITQRIAITSCEVRDVGSGAPPMYFGPCFGGGSWDVTVTTSSIFSGTSTAARLDVNSSGTFRLLQNAHNGATLGSAQVQNFGYSTVLFQ